MYQYNYHAVHVRGYHKSTIAYYSTLSVKVMYLLASYDIEVLFRFIAFVFRANKINNALLTYKINLDHLYIDDILKHMNQ